MEGVQQGPLLQEQLFDLFIYLGAEWVLELLVILSVISVAVTAERLFHFLSHRDDYAMLQEKLDEHLCAGDVDKARALLQSGHSYVASICLAGLDVMERGPGAVEEMMTGATKVARLKLERGLAFLGTLGNNAPFIGLFGTVLGIMRAFKDLAENTTQGSSAVMSGIAEALVATAIGLLVALPAVAVFNTFQRSIRRRLVLCDAVGHIVLSHAKSVKVDK
jgi:biopolymer transport protein ExbB/TolQ